MEKGFSKQESLYHPCMTSYLPDFSLGIYYKPLLSLPNLPDSTSEIVLGEQKKEPVVESELEMPESEESYELVYLRGEPSMVLLPPILYEDRNDFKVNISLLNRVWILSAFQHSQKSC